MESTRCGVYSCNNDGVSGGNSGDGGGEGGGDGSGAIEIKLRLS